jgi:hypothetical protein
MVRPEDGDLDVAVLSERRLEYRDAIVLVRVEIVEPENGDLDVAVLGERRLEYRDAIVLV